MKSRIYFAALVGGALGLSTVGHAEFKRSPEEIRQQRQASIDGILSGDPATDVAIHRGNCMGGQMPHITRRVRKNGSEIAPDAGDRCVAALMRMAADGHLLQPYEKVVSDGDGDPAVAARLPNAIGGAVVGEAGSRVSIGNGRAMTIDPAIAFDAGFTAAYLKGERSTPGMPDLPTLKAISEACLDRTEERLGLCYAAGYAHAVRALQGERVIAD